MGITARRAFTMWSLLDDVIQELLQGLVACKNVRVVTDRAVFGYLADVFVTPEFRGRGVARAIVRACLDHPWLQDA